MSGDFQTDTPSTTLVCCGSLTLNVYAPSGVEYDRQRQPHLKSGEANKIVRCSKRVCARAAHALPRTTEKTSGVSTRQQLVFLRVCQRFSRGR